MDFEFNNISRVEAGERLGRSHEGASMTEFSLHQQVLENIPEGVTIQDRDFNIIYQNAAMKQAFGDQVGGKCYCAYEKREIICEGCGVHRAFQTRKPNIVHRTAITENNQITHWENSCFCLFDNEGNIIAGVEICRDVTDREVLAKEVRERSVELGILNDKLTRKSGQLEEKTHALEQAYQELKQTHTHLLQQEKMASIGQLASGIAHEINTPIQYVGDNITFTRKSFEELTTAMRACLGILVSAETDFNDLPTLYKQVVSMLNASDFDYLKSEVPLALDEAATGIQRITEIVLAMKDFAYSGNKELGPVEIDKLLRSTIEITRNAWKNLVDLQLELADPPLVVNGVWGELGQVILNLIMNAIDAIDDQSQQENMRGKIRVQTRRRDNWGEILVEDSGCGIEPSIEKRIFEPFFTTKEVGRGSGQGLSIAYRIITDTHGGELLVDSELGHGSTFIVRLPLVE
jgi:signal transduction histidine kinase